MDLSSCPETLFYIENWVRLLTDNILFNMLNKFFTFGIWCNF